MEREGRGERRVRGGEIKRIWIEKGQKDGWVEKGKLVVKERRRRSGREGKYMGRKKEGFPHGTAPYCTAVSHDTINYIPIKCI